MAKAKPLSKRKVFSVLKQNGFKVVRSGKHITFKRTTLGGKILTTQVPHHTTVCVAVIKSIMRKTNKPRDEFW